MSINSIRSFFGLYCEKDDYNLVCSMIRKRNKKLGEKADDYQIHPVHMITMHAFRTYQALLNFAHMRKATHITIDQLIRFEPYCVGSDYVERLAIRSLSLINRMP